MQKRQYLKRQIFLQHLWMSAFFEEIKMYIDRLKKSHFRDKIKDNNLQTRRVTWL